LLRHLVAVVGLCGGFQAADPARCRDAWLTAAIEENFGKQHKVQVGGTQIERTSNAAPPFVSATLWCAIPTVRWLRVRQRLKSAFPA